MSENDRVESPIEAQLVAPPPNLTDDASAQSKSGAPTGKTDFSRPWVIVVLILHVGFFGIPFYWRTHYSLATRVMLVVVSIVYTVVAVAIIVWGVMQILKMI